MYSYGPKAIALYCIIAFYVILVLYYNNLSLSLPKQQKSAITGAMIVLLGVAGFQYLVPTSLISSIGITVVIAGLLITNENPIEYVHNISQTFTREGLITVTKDLYAKHQNFWILNITIDELDITNNVISIDTRNYVVGALRRYINRTYKLDVYQPS